MKHMKVSLSNINYRALRRTGTMLLLSALLAACAGGQPKKVEIQAENPAVKISPKVRADFSAAMQAIKTSDYDKAVKLLNQVIAQSPDNPVPYINLAIVYIKAQKLTLSEEYLTLAEKNLKQAIKIDPENPVANNEYALLYRKTGRFAEARQIYERTLTKYPNFMIARRNLGILCDLYMKDYECALKHYVIYSSAMPDDKAVKIWIADLRGR